MEIARIGDRESPKKRSRTVGSAFDDTARDGPEPRFSSERPIVATRKLRHSVHFVTSCKEWVAPIRPTLADRPPAVRRPQPPHTDEDR